MDNSTRREIDRVAWQTLRAAGITEPPVSVKALLEHLELSREFLDLQNPTFRDKMKHRIRVYGRKLNQILKKISLRAVLFHDQNRIVVDETLPAVKRDWPSFHEASHKILVWHNPYFGYGDTAQTLNPDWHERLEAEANRGASALMFCGPVFTKESRDTKPEWAVIEKLKERYDKSFSTTLRRYIEFGPKVPMVMLTSTASWADQPSDQKTRCRHFVPSPSFVEMFSEVTAEQLREQVDVNSKRRRGGLIADFTLCLKDDNGTKHEFRAESFFNSYYVQTLFVQLAEVKSKTIVLPANRKLLRALRGA